MNPDHITDIITALKEDKSCTQPWRNKAVARLEEAIAFIEKGHKEGDPMLQPPSGFDVLATGLANSEKVCTCPAYPAAVDATCPVHGG